MKKQDFRLLHRLRVRWVEVDIQKIVFNAHYLMYFDTALTDYWRALGLPFESAMQQLGGDFYVKKASVEFHASARFDEQLEVALKCTRLGNSSLLFTGAIFRSDQLLVTCELVYVFADPLSQTSRPVPEALRSLIMRYEAGESVLTLKTGDWSTLGPDASALRTAVFVQEQGIAPELEWDKEDHCALHAVLYNALGQVIGTGRLLQLEPQRAKIGRMAVHSAVRGSGVGRHVLAALLNAARERGDTEVVLHAQCSAQAFYTSQGFLACGSSFEEAGMAHIAMVKTL
ncbi:hypothetical protein AwPolaro_07480 [Polaromonas sp.]|nr:hypothetical protein AwPolaro_07480 [Polaromonas sp.]